METEPRMERTTFFFVWSAATKPVAALLPVLRAHMLALSQNFGPNICLLKPRRIDLRIRLLHASAGLSRAASHFIPSFSLLRWTVCRRSIFGVVNEFVVDVLTDDLCVSLLNAVFVVQGISLVDLSSVLEIESW